MDPAALLNHLGLGQTGPFPFVWSIMAQCSSHAHLLSAKEPPKVVEAFSNGLLKIRGGQNGEVLDIHCFCHWFNMEATTKLSTKTDKTGRRTYVVGVFLTTCDTCFLQDVDMSWVLPWHVPHMPLVHRKKSHRRTVLSGLHKPILFILFSASEHDYSIL